MSGFAYRLVVVTHGAAPTLVRCLDAFMAYSNPAPREVVLVVDGPLHRAHEDADERYGMRRVWSAEQQGFCTVTYRAWREAVRPGPEHVVWLEHDFVLTRSVDWRQMAQVLDAHPSLAQMQLMRNAVNEQELAAGGLFESRPGQYTRQVDYADDLDAGDQAGPEIPWLSHKAYFSTNPSLMRRDWMAANPWPDPELVPERCEGIYGFDLVQDGWHFGVWGTGEPWTEHVGVRDGHGY